MMNRFSRESTIINVVIVANYTKLAKLTHHVTVPSMQATNENTPYEYVKGFSPDSRLPGEVILDPATTGGTSSRLLSKSNLPVRLYKDNPKRSLLRGEPIMPSTIRLHRVLRAAPERVYRAFLDPDAMVKWLPPNGFTGRMHEMDARVGGSYKMSFTNFSTGRSQSFGGEYLELVPHERIRYSDRFDDPNLPGEMQTTVIFKKVSCGTEVNITQEGIPDVIPAEACYLGWQESLVLLTKLVEAEIPDE
jgi:uncharacterized protein YndB with AHSA1/START domain